MSPICPFHHQPIPRLATLTQLGRWVDTIARAVAVAVPATSGTHMSELDVACGPVQFSYPGKGATAPLQRYHYPQTPNTPIVSTVTQRTEKKGPTLLSGVQ